MKKHRLFIFFMLSFFSCSLQGMTDFDPVSSDETNALALPGEQVFHAQQETAYRSALQEFVARVKDHFEKNVIPSIKDDLLTSYHQHCVIYDIDDTVVDRNKPISPHLDALDPSHHFEAIPEMLELYTWLRSHNIHIIFITARVDQHMYKNEHRDVVAITASNLTLVGYTGFENIIFMSNEVYGPDESRAYFVPAFKTHARYGLEKNGWYIHATLDDRAEIFDCHNVTNEENVSIDELGPVCQEAMKRIHENHSDPLCTGKPFRVPRRDDQV